MSKKLNKKFTHLHKIRSGTFFGFAASAAFGAEVDRLFPNVLETKNEKKLMIKLLLKKKNSTNLMTKLQAGVELPRRFSLH